MKKYIITIAITLIVAISAFAQTKIFINLEGNYTTIPDFEINETYGFWSYGYPGTTKEEYSTTTGYIFSVGITQKLSDRFYINGAVGLNRKYFERSAEKYLEDQSVNTDYLWGIDEFSYNYKAIVMYINIPIIISYSIIDDRFRVGGGITNTFLGTSEFRDENSDIFNSDYNSNEDLSDHLIGAQITSELRLLSKLWLNASYNYSLTPIFKEVAQYAGKARYQNINIGLQLFFN